MRKPSSLPGKFVRAIITSHHQIPLFSWPVRAGFPSPAESYVERVCDLNDLCINNQEATYFVRVTGDSMEGDHIREGDILVVDCSIKPTDGKIIVAWLNGEHTLKRIHYAKEMVVLMPSNEKYLPIYVHETDDFKPFGVVTFVIHKC